MLCACYGASEEDGQFQTPIKAGWVRSRLVGTFAVERRRWFVLRVFERGASLSYYADDGGRRLLGSLPLASLDAIGDVALMVRLCTRCHPREVVMTLRFEALEEKIDWWRRIREATRRDVEPASPRKRSSSTTALGDGDSDESPVNRRDRRNSETVAVERGVVWESHGMCVVEDAEGRVSIEPRLVYQAKVAYSRIVRAYIRPPRADYELAALGPRAFVFGDRSYARRDKEIRNARGRLVRYSVWREVSKSRTQSKHFARPDERKEPEPPSGDDENDERAPRATIVYAHGNASSRVEGLSQLSLALSLGRGVQFVALDCCGSGLSEGEFVSLGLKEQDDVVAVLDAERAALGKVALWGRSMGAVTTLLVSATRDPDVAAVVCDSAYASLRDLSLDVARRGAASLPTFVARSALRWIRDSVLRRADFDIFDVDALKHAPECAAPAFFICAADDNFVEASHTARLHDALGSDVKELCVCPGSHNSTRPTEAFDRVEAFLRNALGLPDDRPFASTLDKDLEGLLPESRQDRPNFAALSPWIIENLRAKRRDALANADAPPAPRWLEQDRVDLVVDHMQATTLAAAEEIARFV
ncbi:hypothetical protein CTAYLR_004810 [Chrysophaeum taylorii]|uniref:PH domain-containing protein n=1 Tax=Chrysophaeum taylorii TaxID=2483200 RepID=A0AAD7XRG2_9STRA|nr:hypothetical protein CTAYLR_004810 [Chrysophaeum taylorii]